MEGIDFTNTYWDRVRGFVSEFRIDARWILREIGSNKPFGSLRIVSHPDCPPGHLKAIFTYVTSIKKRNDYEILKTLKDYCVSQEELEVFSIKDDIKTETKIVEDFFKNLENLFNVKIIE